MSITELPTAATTPSSDTPPSDTPPSDTPSLDTLLTDVALAGPDATALVVAGETWTYAELERTATRMAQAMRADGVLPGDRVAALARNSCQLVALHFAAARAGVVLVPLNWRQSAREMASVLADAEPSLLLVQQGWASLLEEADRSIPTVWLDGEAGARGSSYQDWLARGDEEVLLATDPVEDPVVLMLYTTGTTGRPKGVLISMSGLMAALEEFIDSYSLGPDCRYLAAFPLFHVGGMYNFLAPLLVGGTVLSLDDTTQVAREIADSGATHTGLVPTLINQLVHDPRARTLDLSRLQFMGYGAAPASDSVIARAQELLPRCAFVQGYGMTENTGTVTISAFSRLGNAEEPVGTVGRVVEGTEVRIVDPEKLEDQPVGTAGEIWVRGPHVARGYWRRPEETAKTFLEDGWLRTGDIGVFDVDGFLFIRDRIKDMIITGGENVYSIEVENVLMAHPDVVEVAVYGIPDERWGETVKAVVALDPGSRLTERALIDHTRERLAHYKCPAVVEFTGSLPKSGNGKILKHELRNRDRAAAATT